MNLNTKVQKISGIGEKTAQKLKRLGIESIKDLMYHFPYRYRDFSQIKKISQIQIGKENILKGKIISISNARSFRRRMKITNAILKDSSGSIKLVWFNQPFLTQNIKKGTEIIVSGKIISQKYGIFIQSPEYEIVANSAPKIIPIYPLTAKISSKQIRNIIYRVLKKNKIPEFLPTTIIKSQNLISLDSAIKKIHQPKNQKDILCARKRLGFDELFLLQLKAVLAKKNWQTQKAPIIKSKPKTIAKIIKDLNFRLTNAQKKTTSEILKDLCLKKPMNRLLQGDVGSGKTIVATIASAVAAENHFQSVLMAPTEVLAFQHFETFKKLLKNHQISIALLTSSKAEIFGLDQKKIKRSDLKKAIKLGEIDIVIGTQALISKDMKYHNLGLVLIDEQHRFGVKQRLALREKSKFFPHILLMTATPIPRTLNLALFGDLDVSIIDELPKDRQKIVTKIISEKQRKKAYQFLLNQIKNGRQAFVVCPLIEAGENIDYDNRKAVVFEHKKLLKQFPNLKIALLHGKMKSKEKNKIMFDFKNKKYQILVSTSVIEVGIDIPNVSIIMIEGAERFGLAQLHQLRGRVGRGKHQSFCLLFLEKFEAQENARLKAMEQISDGFKLADIDLKLRGPGEIYGIQQSGYLDLKIAELGNLSAIKNARQEAEKIVLKINKYSKLKNKIKEIEFKKI